RLRQRCDFARRARLALASASTSRKQGHRRQARPCRNENDHPLRHVAGAPWGVSPVECQEASLPDDDMMQQLDIQKLARFAQFFRCPDVLGSEGVEPPEGRSCTTTSAGQVRLTAGPKTSAARTTLRLTVP